METIKIVRPTLAAYRARVRQLAQKYLGNADSWPQLTERLIHDPTDRDEFSFIRMALWDLLLQQESSR